MKTFRSDEFLAENPNWAAGVRNSIHKYIANNCKNYCYPISKAPFDVLVGTNGFWVKFYYTCEGVENLRAGLCVLAQRIASQHKILMDGLTIDVVDGRNAAVTLRVRVPPIEVEIGE